MAKYEGSKADRSHDKKEAKIHKESLKTWENSKLDKKMDAVGQRKLNKKKK